MKTELLTGNPGSVVNQVKKLLAANPNWRCGQFSATAAPSDGQTRVALAMELPDNPDGPRLNDLTITSGTESQVRKTVADRLSHPTWQLARLCSFFRTNSKNKEQACLAALVTQSSR